MIEIFGTTGPDSLDITQANSLVFSGAESDTITGKVPVNPVSPTTGGKYFGGGDIDTIYVQNGDRVFGGEGNDVIMNVAGSNNQLFGGAGNDEIYGGKGDILVGGSGADEFWYVDILNADNTILDFNRTQEDKIVIDSVTGITKESLVFDITTSAGDTILKSGNVTLSTVRGIELTLDDIVIDSFLTPDNAPSTFQGAVNINLPIVGPLTKEGSLEGSFSRTDTADMYKFKIVDPSNVTIDLTGMLPSSDADILLIKDNGDGIFVASEDTFLGSSQNQGNANEKISVEALAAGEYFIQLSQVAGFSNYTLSVEAVSNFTGLTEDNGGNNFSAAGELGTLATIPSLITKAGSFSSQDAVDAFSFVIDNTTPVNVKVTLSGSFDQFNYANLFLIKDDGDNNFEASEDTFLGVSQTPGSAQEFTVTNLLAGEYFIKIDHVAGAANYTLNLEAGLIEDNGGLDFASAGDLGTLEVTNPITKEGSFTSQDNVDMFSFVIDNTTPVNVKVTLDGSFDQSNYADLFLIQDDGDNIYIAADDVIEASQIVGSDQEITMSGLSAGTYFISINHVLGLANYTLGLAIV